MSPKIIAIVRLARGESAWYDEFTNIHLTLSHPQENIIEGMNLVRIKRAVKNNVLTLVAGSLEEKVEKQEPHIVQESITSEPETPKEPEKIPASETEKTETPENIEESSEKITPEKTAAKKSSKKSGKKAESKTETEADEAK